jgi:NADPH:quinone reductase
MAIFFKQQGETMRAVRVHAYGGPEQLLIEDVPVPEPKADEVLIKVAVAGVNYADLLQRQGTYPLPISLPTILGSEVAGVVVAVGKQVEHLPVGTRVVAGTMGGAYAEYTAARATQVIPLPPQLEFAPATALFAQGLTAQLLLADAAHVQPGEAVLITAAAGGVGSLLVQLAKLHGAQPVIAAISNAAKREYVEALGADAVVVYDTPDWPEQVRAATNGAGVPTAFDAVGGAIGAQTLAALAPFGRLVVYGAASGEATPYDATHLSFQNLSVRGFAMPSYPPATIQAAAQALLESVISGKIRLHVSAAFPLAQAAEAHEAIAGRQTTGKVVLVVDEQL